MHTQRHPSLTASSIIALLACCSALTIFLWRVATGLHLFEFVDEAEKFVAAQLIGQGLRLYLDVFSHHGPAPYIIAHGYTVLVSMHDFTSIRLIQPLLALLACLAVSSSPAFTTHSGRKVASAVFLALLSAVWVPQGLHMILYQSISGFLLTIPLALMVVPALLGQPPGRLGLFLSGCALTLACFAAFPLGPACVLLVAATLLAAPSDRSRVALLKPLCAGLLAAALGVLAWMGLFADITGYFIYHVYFNQHVYAEFYGISPLDVLRNFSVSLAPGHIVHTLALAAFLAWMGILARESTRGLVAPAAARRLLALFLAAGAALFLNLRGEPIFHNAGFVIANLALLAMACGCIVQHWEQALSRPGIGLALLCCCLVVAGAELAARNAISTPHGLPRDQWAEHKAYPRPQTGHPYDLIRSLTEEKQDFLALIINPGLYLKLGRLPASGHFYYLPWQAAYNRDPILGYRIDLCQDLETHQPAVIWFDDWRVWGRYSIGDYEPCVPEFIQEHYHLLEDYRLYHIRKKNLHITNN